MALSCGYPIYCTLSVLTDGYKDYEIKYKGETVFTGRVYSSSADGGSVKIDIAPICREYLDTNYETFSNLAGTSATTIGTFTVEGGESKTVCYNYNTDYILEIAEGANLNAPLTDKVDPRQYIGSSVLTSGGITVSHSVPAGGVGDTVTVGEHEYTIVPSCKNRYALYYVNKNGGIDYLLCSGKASDKWGADRIDAQIYFDRTDRKSFGNVRFNQYVKRKYELNTGWLPDDRARNIDHLIYSPKVWIHDLENDTITACIIDDNDCTVKSFKNDRSIVNYTINITEDKEFIRK